MPPPEIVAALIIATSNLALFVMQQRIGKKQDRLAEKVEITHDLVNSKMTELLAAARGEALAKGTAAGIAKGTADEKARADAATVQANAVEKAQAEEPKK